MREYPSHWLIGNAPREFLGQPVSYWLNLQRYVDELNTSGLWAENNKLRGIVAFYESKIKEINTFQEKMK